MSVTYKCPTCEAKLRTPKRVPPGKSVTCPNCTEEFTPEPAAGIARDWRMAGQALVTEAPSAMVVSGHPLASQVGRDVLRSGGNAVDAAVAVGFALAVVHPEAGNIGGGGFMVIRTADGKVRTLDYRETAPGRYVAAAVESLEQGRQFVPEFQEEVRRRGRTFDIDEGGSAALAIELARGL